MHDPEDGSGSPPSEIIGVAAGSTRLEVANRPDPGWLDAVECELDDVDVVLKCLARDSATICTACDELQGTGELEGRAVLARCAGTKLPR